MVYGNSQEKVKETSKYLKTVFTLNYTRICYYSTLTLNHIYIGISIDIEGVFLIENKKSIEPKQ